MHSANPLLQYPAYGVTNHPKLGRQPACLTYWHCLRRGGQDQRAYFSHLHKCGQPRIVSTTVFIRGGGVCQGCAVSSGDLIFMVARACEGQHFSFSCIHLLHFLLYRLRRAASWLASSPFGLLYRLLSFSFMNSRTTLQKSARKGQEKVVWPQFYTQYSRSSQGGIQDALPLVFVP
jgi:hypothetical protein